MTRCTKCPQWYELYDRRPVTAHRHACQHAVKNPGHESYVINIQLLKVVQRYHFGEALFGTKDPVQLGTKDPSEPPF